MKAEETKAAVKPAAEVETAAKPVEKAADVKKEDKAAEVKAAPAAQKKAAAPAEKAPAKKAPAKKAAPAAKKETVKKAPAAKKAEPKASVFVEYADKKVAAKDILAAAEKDFESRNKGVAIETIEIYVKPEENAAYYVVNGIGSNDYKVNL
ncbi:hypothetical protein GPL15_25955 [Clostridium sp. MCC353]|nr:hypothetical protein [Clostridium sp. MCC353]